MSTDETREAAVQAGTQAHHDRYCLSQQSDWHQGYNAEDCVNSYRRSVEHILTAAAPLIEAEVRADAAEQLRRVQHDLQHVAAERDRAKAELRRVRADERERIAQEIRGELVCCDIFERLEATLGPDTSDPDKGEPPTGQKVTAAYRVLRRSSSYHAICHFGAWAAAIARATPTTTGTSEEQPNA